MCRLHCKHQKNIEAGLEHLVRATGRDYEIVCEGCQYTLISPLGAKYEPRDAVAMSRTLNTMTNAAIGR